MPSSNRGASHLNIRSTLIDKVVRGRRSRIWLFRFSGMKERGPMLGHTANGPARRIRLWSRDGTCRSNWKRPAAIAVKPEGPLGQIRLMRALSRELEAVFEGGRESGDSVTLEQGRYVL